MVVFRRTCSRGTLRRRLGRLGLVLLSAFLASPVVAIPPAQAAASNLCVSPHPAAACSGFSASNRFTTLTAAIAAASAGDSIDIYPGTYTDHPNVNKAGLRITGVAGKTATIFDGGGSTPITVSAGGVVIDGLSTRHGNGGIDAGNTPIAGDFTLMNFATDGNHSSLACSTSHTCYGVWVVASGNIVLANGTASGNGSSAGCSGNAPDAEHSPGFDGETCFGVLALSTGGKVTLTNLTANNNGTVGGPPANCSLHETCFGVLADEVSGDVTLTKVTANGNGASGDCAETGGSHQGDFCFGVGADGALGNVAMSQITANDNGAGGNCVATGDRGSDICYGILDDGDTTGDFTLTDVQTNNNGARRDCLADDSCLGVLIDGGSFGTGNATLTDVTADFNTAGRDCRGADGCFGVSVDGVIGNITIADSQVNHNKAGGNCSRLESCFGILAESDGRGNIVLHDVPANQNGASGTCTGGPNCWGVTADTITEVPEGPAGPGNVDLSGVSTNQNTGDGVDVNASGTITITDLNSNLNGGQNLKTNKPPV